MKQAARDLEFEKAAALRDQIVELRRDQAALGEDLQEWRRSGLWPAPSSTEAQRACVTPALTSGQVCPFFAGVGCSLVPSNRRFHARAVMICAPAVAGVVRV